MPQTWFNASMQIARKFISESFPVLSGDCGSQLALSSSKGTVGSNGAGIASVASNTIPNIWPLRPHANYGKLQATKPLSAGDGFQSLARSSSELLCGSFDFSR